MGRSFCFLLQNRSLAFQGPPGQPTVERGGKLEEVRALSDGGPEAGLKDQGSAPDGSPHLTPHRAAAAPPWPLQQLDFLLLTAERKGKHVASACQLHGDGGSVPHLFSLQNILFIIFFCKTRGIIAACIHGLTILHIKGVGVVATSQPRAYAHPPLKLQLQARDELTQQRARLSHGQENPRAFNPKSPKPARPLRAPLVFIASAPLTYAEIQFCHLPHPLQLQNPPACATKLPAALQFAASPPDHGTATSS